MLMGSIVGSAVGADDGIAVGAAVGRAVGCPVGIVDGDGDGRGVGSKLHWTTMFELTDHADPVHSLQSPDTSGRSSPETICMPREVEAQSSASEPMNQ